MKMKAAITVSILCCLVACGNEKKNNTSNTGDKNSTPVVDPNSANNPNSPATDPNAPTVGATGTAVSLKSATGAVTLIDALYEPAANVTPATAKKAYTLVISDYSVCGWAVEQHSYTGHPNNAHILAFYLLNTTGGTINAPAAGTYNVQAPGTDGMFIDPTASGYGVFANSCTGTWPGLTSGTVTITSIQGTAVTGTVNVTLMDGTTVTGPFTSAACTGNEKSGAPAGSTDCPW